MTGAGAAALTAAAVFMAPAAAAAPADQLEDAAQAAQEEAEQAIDQAQESLEDARDEAEQAVDGGSDDARESAQQAIEDAQQALENARDEAEQAVEAGGDEAQERAQQAIEEAQQALDNARDEAEQAVEEGSNEAQERAQQAIEEAQQTLENAQDEAEQAVDRARGDAADVFGSMPQIGMGDWLPDDLRRDLQELQDLPADERGQELQDIAREGLSGSYGDEVEDWTERIGGLISSLPRELRQDIQAVFGQEPEEARGDLRQIMEGAVDGEYGEDVEQWADWLRDNAQRWDLARIIQGSSGAGQDDGGS